MFLGIEIGGTKLQIGVGAGDGALAGLWRGGVNVADGPEGIRRQIIAGVPELLERSNVTRDRLRGVGVGFGGPVDDATRTVIKSHQIVGWDGFPLADWIGEVVGLSSVLGNDADVAGLAEALFGAGRGFSPLFYITIGSGIGGGLIIDGKIYRGCGRGAAEIGHLSTLVPGSAANARQPVEAEASGWAIERRAREAAARGGSRSEALLQEAGGELGSISTRDVAKAAAQGDPLALEILRGAWAALAEAICNVIALMCPRRIIIGGGVALMGEDLLFKPLRRFVAERVFTPFVDCYEIVPAGLGEEVVVHGALALARQEIVGFGV